MATRLPVKTMEKDEPGESSTLLVKLSEPPAEIASSQEDIEEIGERFKRRAFDLDEEQRPKLEALVKKIIDDWITSRTSLIQKLRDWNDLYEGVTTITDSPWPGASSLTIPLPKIKGREIRSVIMRSTMRTIPFLLTKYAGPDALYEDSRDFTKALEDFVEDKIKNDTNVHETLKEGIIPAFRDGTCPIQISWETDVEMVSDYKSYTKIDDFVVDYPTAEDAGLSDENYSKILHKLGNGDTYDVRYEYEVVNYDGPKAHIVSLLDFVHWPVFIPRVEDLLCFGKRVWYTDYQLQDMVNSGKFDQEMVDGLVNKGGELRIRENLTQSRDSIEGINRSAGEKSHEFEFFELVIKASLTPSDIKNKIRRKYLLYFHEASGKIFYITDYPIRKGRPNYFLMRLIKRDGRLLGVSLVDDISDLCLEINIIHRQRINSRTISHVPSFKAKDTAKGRFDPSDRRYRFRPGVVFWLANMDDVQQFDIRPVDLSGSVEEEMLQYQLVDMVTGSTSANSGQMSAMDPRAPARKQQEMLRQSSNRIDDYVESLIPVFGQVGSFFVDLYYQYGTDRIKYYATDKDGQTVEREIKRDKLYNPNIMFVVNGTSIYESPDQEYQRAVEIDQIVANNPITAQDPKIRRNSLGRVLSASRTQDYKALLPSDQQVQPVTDPATGLLKTPDQTDQDAKTALQNQKLASKVGLEKDRQDHAVDKILLQGHVDSQLQSQDAAAQAALSQIPTPGGPPNAA